MRTATHASLTLIDQALMSLASFLLTVLVARSCGQEELGYYVFGITFGWLVLGIPNALVWVPYSTKAPQAKTPGHLRTLRGNSLAMLLGLAACATLLPLLAGLIAWMIPAWLPQATWLSLAVTYAVPLAVLLLSMMLREHIRRQSIAEFRGQQLLAIDLLVFVLQVGIALALFMTGYLTVVNAFYAVATAGAVAAAFLLFSSAEYQVRRRPLAVHAIRNWRFGKWLLIMAMFYLVADVLLRSLLVGFHGAKDLGTYSAAAAIGSLINPLVLAVMVFSRSWAAKVFAATGEPGLARFVAIGTAAAVVGVAIAVVALTTVGPWLLGRLFDVDDATAPLIAAVSLGWSAQAILIPVEGAQVVLEHGRNLFRVSLMQLILTALIGVPFVWAWGPIGVGLTLACRAGAALVYQWLQFHRSLDGNRRPLPLAFGGTVR